MSKLGMSEYFPVWKYTYISEITTIRVPSGPKLPR